MEPLNFVYVCRSGENEELRYSIRSVLKFFPNAKIWVVGQKPSWYSGPYIKVKEYPKSKHHAVYQNLKEIAYNPKLPEDLVIMNDDFFFTEDPGTIGHYFQDKLIKKVSVYERDFPESSYTKRLRKAYNYLKKNHIMIPLDYELHVPMKIKKSKLCKAIEHNIPWRSAYGNLFRVGGKQIEDVKVYLKESKELGGYDYLSESQPFLSTDEESFNEIKDSFLSLRLPDPSPYE
jgi:hypothetical protein